MSGEFLPVLNHSGATAGYRVGHMESEHRINSAKSGLNWCPETELNCRHVDFQSAVPFSTEWRKSCRSRTRHHVQPQSFLPELNQNFGEGAFAGFVPPSGPRSLLPTPSRIPSKGAAS